MKHYEVSALNCVESYTLSTEERPILISVASEFLLNQLDRIFYAWLRSTPARRQFGEAVEYVCQPPYGL